ncbi:hypothetical protein BDA96_04G145500, partial [Sorghum bicolor]
PQNKIPHGSALLPPCLLFFLPTLVHTLGTRRSCLPELANTDLPTRHPSGEPRPVCAQELRRRGGTRLQRALFRRDRTVGCPCATTSFSSSSCRRRSHDADAQEEFEALCFEFGIELDDVICGRRLWSWRSRDSLLVHARWVDKASVSWACEHGLFADGVVEHPTLS